MIRNFFRRLFEFLHVRRVHRPRLLPEPERLGFFTRLQGCNSNSSKHDMCGPRCVWKRDTLALPAPAEPAVPAPALRWADDTRRVEDAKRAIAEMSRPRLCRQGHLTDGTWCWTCDRGVSGCDRSCFTESDGLIRHGRTCERPDDYKRPPATSMPGPPDRRT